MNGKHPYSVHSFMMPLRWDFLPENFNFRDGKYSIDFDTRTKLQTFADKLKDTMWERGFYRIDKNPENYNENTYFHAFASLTIFDLQQSDEPETNIVSGNKTMIYFEIKYTEGDYYKITTNDKEYLLDLTGIGLHVYTTGIAILTFNLKNMHHNTPEDILRINEFGRRIYPQFLGNTQPFTMKTKSEFLSNKIEIKLNNVNHGLPFFDDFTQYDTLFKKETHTINHLNEYESYSIVDIPFIIKKLFHNDNFVFDANGEKQGDVIRLNMLTDDRMFFQCWYGNDEYASQNCNECAMTNDKGKMNFSYLHDKFWYAFLYGDRGVNNLGIGNKFMMEKNIVDNTYDRWAGYGTLYGFTRDSFVALSQSLETLLKNAPDISIHMKTIYYHMAVLCLAQRASVLRFSAEVSSIADLGKKRAPEQDKKLTKNIQKLYLNYIEFINKIYFREITPQIQGIEIYSQFQKIMNIHADVKDLDTEIGELHEYVNLIQNDRRNEEAAKLNKLAAFFLPFTLVFSILGANIFPGNENHFWTSKSFWSLITGLTISVAIYFGLDQYLKRRKSNE